MKRAAQIVSFLALGATLASPVLFFLDKLDLAQTQLCLAAATLAWLLTAPFWMEHKA